MATCDDLIKSGIVKDCSVINAPIGVNKDLILVNFDDFDRNETLDILNFESDNVNLNEQGLSAIVLKAGAVQYEFQSTDYSVIPTVTSEVKEDGDSWYLHSVAFTVYNKSAKARETIRTLGNSLVIAIAIDRSTGLYELFGADQGLKLGAVERAYVGAQTSNFYTITIQTPDIAVVRESSLGLLANSIVTTA